MNEALILGLTQAKEESPIDEISHDELISTIERELVCSSTSDRQPCCSLKPFACLMSVESLS